MPTGRELAAIFSHFECNIIVIDDFEVPDDPGYGFDDYGGGKKLSIDYLQVVAGGVAMMVFFPAASSGEKTGARRGCCLITSNPELGERFKRLPELRFFGSIASAR